MKIKSVYCAIILILIICQNAFAFYCANCGKKAKENYKFCSFCGEKILVDKNNLIEKDKFEKLNIQEQIITDDISYPNIKKLKPINYDKAFEKKTSISIIDKNKDEVMIELKNKLLPEDNFKTVYFFCTTRKNISLKQFWKWSWLSIPWDITTYPLARLFSMGTDIPLKKKNEIAKENNRKIIPLIEKRKEIIDNENLKIAQHNNKIQEYEIEQEKLRQQIAKEQELEKQRILAEARKKELELERIRLQKMFSQYGDTPKEQILNVAQKIVNAKKEAGYLYRTQGYTERVKELIDIQRDLANIFGKLYSIVSQEPDFIKWYQQNQYTLQAIQYQY